MTFDPDFKVTAYFEVEYLEKNGAFRDKVAYYCTLVGNHI